MPRWTSEELARHLAKSAPKQDQPTAGDEPESSLHDFIREEVIRRGWLCFHGSMAHRTKRSLGEPDFEILTPGAGLLLLEVKSRHGKLRPEQLATAAHARKLGHTIHVVRTRREFLELIQHHENQKQ